MQPFDYLNTLPGLIWVIACIPVGIILAVSGVYLLNHIPAKWLCDYDETPSEELISGKRFSYISTGIPTAIVMTVCLVLCRLQFNKGFDIYFIMLSLIIFTAVLIAAADLKYQIIPDQFTIALGVFALGVSVYDLVRGYGILHSAWWSPLAGAAIGAAVMIIIDFLGMLVYHREGMGFGDVKLFFAVGLLTGFPGTIYAFIISVITATVFFVGIIIAVRIIGIGGEKEKEMDEPEKDSPGEDKKSPEEDKESETTQNENTADENENKNDNDNTHVQEQEEDGEQEDDGKVGLGSYLAFGPYIAVAVCAYIALFDLIQYLAGLYLNLFN